MLYRFGLLGVRLVVQVFYLLYRALKRLKSQKYPHIFGFSNYVVLVLHWLWFLPNTWVQTIFYYVVHMWWTYPLEVQTWVGWDSTCDILYHSRHRTEADPWRNSTRTLYTSALYTTIHTISEGRKTHIVLWGAAHVAALALYALPAVRLHSGHHYRSELQAGGVPCVWNNVCHFTLLQTFLLKTDFSCCYSNSSSQLYLSYLSVRSRSRTPALLTGQSCDWFWSLPGRSHSNY